MRNIVVGRTRGGAPWTATSRPPGLSTRNPFIHRAYRRAYSRHSNANDKETKGNAVHGERHAPSMPRARLSRLS